MRPEGERAGARAALGPGDGSGGVGGITRGKGLLASPSGADRLPLSSLHPPEPKKREGRRDLRLRKNNNEITITKANTGARSLQPQNPRQITKSANCLPDKLVPKSSVTGQERRDRKR